MLKIAVHGYSSVGQLEVESRLVQIVIDCHGWILEERAISITGYCLRFEIPLSDIPDIYGELQHAGLQLTPLAHRAMTEMCLCRKHLLPSEEAQIVSIDLYVGMLDEERLRFRRLVRMHFV
ncbi:MAG: hypothetical protein ABI164_08680 [Acidobacteriaceae bacterium]